MKTERVPQMNEVSTLALHLCSSQERPWGCQAGRVWKRTWRQGQLSPRVPSLKKKKKKSTQFGQDSPPPPAVACHVGRASAVLSPSARCRAWALVSFRYGGFSFKLERETDCAGATEQGRTGAGRPECRPRRPRPTQWPSARPALLPTAFGAKVRGQGQTRPK